MEHGIFQAFENCQLIKRQANQSSYLFIAYVFVQQLFVVST